MPYLICQYQPCSKSFYVKPSHLASKTHRYHSYECRRLAFHADVAQRTEKECPQCHIPKSLNEFHISQDRPDGHQSICKECISTRDKTMRRDRGLKLPTHPHVTIDPETGRFISVIPLIERFWSYVDTSAGSDACWPWTGATDDHGYGIITIRQSDDLPPGLPKHEKSTTYLAPRVAYAMMIGPIPHGMDILHRCDNGLCVNAYKDLYPGTQQQNMHDRHTRKRDPSGERNGNVSLTDEQAREIFLLKGKYSSLTVAPWYKVSSSSILNIWNKVTWNHIHNE